MTGPRETQPRHPGARQQALAHRRVDAFAFRCACPACRPVEDARVCARL